MEENKVIKMSLKKLLIIILLIIVFAFAHVSIKKQLNNHGLITVTSVVISIVIKTKLSTIF